MLNLILRNMMSQWNPRRSRGARRPGIPGRLRGRSQWNPRRSRGARWPVGYTMHWDGVSVEPPPKQGCELVASYGIPNSSRLSGTPAEAGVRGETCRQTRRKTRSQWNPRRSRGARNLVDDWIAENDESQWNPRRSRGASSGALRGAGGRGVSAEPPPKQGCETYNQAQELGGQVSQWNPRRSRGARSMWQDIDLHIGLSQWNPRRSRGAR